MSRVLAAYHVPSRAALATRLPAERVGELPPLTPAQTRVVASLVGGSSNAQIAEALGVSVRTVEKHVTDVLRVWAVPNRVGIVRKAMAGE
jgi:DNA-binding NarL/FixJ family response regulator